MNRITLICNRNYSVKKFRLGLINDLKKHNYKVSLIIIDDSNEKIEIDDVDIYYIADNNRNINPLSKLSLKNKIKEILLKTKPNYVFTFQVTPNTFGVFAANECNIKKIYSMVEGTGDVFLYNSLKWRLIRLVTCFLFRLAFKKCEKVFFINNDDKEEFISRKLLNREKCEVIPGVGVDINYFSYKPVKNTDTFIMMARMSKTKGVYEYCEAARQIKKKYPNVVFNYIGEEFTLKKSDIQEYIDDNSINYLGWKEDVREDIENCFMNILPSYREGFGLVIAEAGAVGRASIANNCIGCKDAIDDKKTGILVNNNDLVSAITYSLEHKEEIIQMGINARKKAEQMFDKNVINKKIIETIEYENII